MNGIPDPGRAEEWRAIPGFPHYEVSSFGRVRSLPRPVPVGAHGGQRITPARILRQWPSTTGGYPVVALGKRDQRKVHQLVLLAFVGPQPEGLVSRHLNDDRTDNRVSNLAYGTQTENNLDSIRNGHNPNVNKTHCPKGHPYSGDNLKVFDNGRKRKRYCRTCSNTRPGPSARERLARMAAAVVAV